MGDTLPTIDVTGNFSDDVHGMVRDAALRAPLATDATTGAVIVLGHADVDTLAHDQRLTGVGLALFDFMGITEGPLRDWYGRLMFTTEGDYHRRMRSLVSRAFTPRSVDALRQTATEMADAAVASVGDGDDLVSACSTLATRLTCRLIGVPESDVADFAHWADDLSPVFSFMTAEQIAAATDALAGLRDHVDELTRRRSDDPGSDLVTRLLAAEADGLRLSHDETVTMIANLLVAGHDTAGSQIPCSIMVALQNRDRIGDVLQDRARLVSVVAETMRMQPSIPIIPRTAVEPIDLHGTTIPAGSLVYLCLVSACRDPAAWADPDQFDPERFLRPDAPKLLNFGAGTHYCLGTALAKLSVEESVRAVLARVPALRLADDPADIPWRQVLGRSPARLVAAAA